VSYTIGTILTRKKPFKTKEREPFNEIRVIGNSPIQTLGRASEWQGQAGEDISVTSTGFSAVVDRALGELERDYDVLSIPEEPVIAPPDTIQRVQPGPSPEEVFRKQALEATSASV
jgi:hypothetical protein